MNTPAHLLLGAALMGRERKVFTAALFGAILPDASLYFLAGVSLFVLNIPPQIVFDELYFSRTWQTVFAIDNSALLWITLLGISLWKRSAWAVALCGAALLHIALDLPLHHDDGRAHFWPLTGWVYQSPVSYWDITRGAGVIAPIEAMLSIAAAIILWRARLGWTRALTVLAILAAEIWIVRTWLFVFPQTIS